MSRPTSHPISKSSSNIRTLTYVLIVTFLVLILSFRTVEAQPSLVPHEIVELAINTAEKIDAEELILNPPPSTRALGIDDLDGDQKLNTLRFLAMDAAAFRNDLNLNELLSIYGQEAKRQASTRDTDIAEIIRLYQNLQSQDTSSEPGLSNLKKLRAYQDNKDWFVAQRSVLLEASLPTFQGNYDVSLKETKHALSLIPSKLSLEVIEAQYETYDQIAYLQFILNNIELGVKTSEQVIEKGIAHGRSIDGISMINNMSFAFNSWHEYDVTEKLAKILLGISEKTDKSSNSFVYFRYGQAQSNAGHFEDALDTLDTALRHTDDLKLINSIELVRATAFAGLGRTEQARKTLDAVEESIKTNELTISTFNETKLRILALIAENQNDAALTAKISNQRLKTAVQLQLSRQAKGIQSLQANLENDKDRVAEREAALVRESELKQAELEAKQRSNVFLMALAASLLLIAICSIAFAVWRQKISKILKIAAHDAEAGDRAKSQFLSVMSHELRTPLNGIIGIAGILSEKGETEELRNYNKLILKSGENLLQLLSGILDMAQMESGKLSIVTAPASIRQIIEGLYFAAKADVDASKVQFTCFVADNIPDDLMLDSIRVKQGLSNLIANAVRFTEKGRVHIHATMSEPDRKGVRDLTMIVADTGRGITDEVKAKLFKPFVQADSTLTRTHDGAGIGLAVTRGLSRLMGGDVTMTSTAGRGSEFTMVVKTCSAAEARVDPKTNRPVFEIEPNAAAKVDFSPAVSIEKLRANAEAKEKAQIKQDLHGIEAEKEVVAKPRVEVTDLDFSDDDDIDFETIGSDINTEPDADSVSPNLGKETLSLPDTSENPRAGFSRQHPRSDTTDIEPDQLSGLNILVVEDIEANLEVLCSLLEPVGCSVSSAENGQVAVDMMNAQTFDAIIMDIRMPIMDGIEATKAIRNLPEPHCSTAIIALTADASAENNAECLAAGADVFLTKPVVVSELFSSIRFARRKQFRQKQQALSA